MLGGDFEEAWRQTDRIEIPRRADRRAGIYQRRPEYLVWDGTSFDGKTVHVRCEHGLGDTIQFLRYLPRLKARAERVIFSVQPLLLKLCEAAPGVDVLRNGWSPEPWPESDVEIECMEFPYAFRDSVKTLPGEVPYLDVELIRRTGKRMEVANKERLNVGVTWSCSAWDNERSVPFPDLAPIWNVPGCDFYCLQQDVDFSNLQRPLPFQIWSEHTTEIRDAAAALLSLDLVITVDSMLAHLAGALGLPVFLLLKHHADWRWMSDRNDSPWYPRTRLFRQPAKGDWITATRSLSEALQQQRSEWSRSISRQSTNA